MVMVSLRYLILMVEIDMVRPMPSSQLSPSKQIMQMLKLQPFIFPCYAVVPHLFIAFVFLLSNIVGIGIYTLPMIPFCLGMTHHLSPDDNLF